MIFNTMLLKQLIVGKTRMLDKTQKLLLMFIVYFGLVFQKTMCALPPHLYNPQVWIFSCPPWIIQVGTFHLKMVCFPLSE